MGTLSTSFDTLKIGQEVTVEHHYYSKVKISVLKCVRVTPTMFDLEATVRPGAVKPTSLRFRKKDGYEPGHVAVGYYCRAVRVTSGGDRVEIRRQNAERRARASLEVLRVKEEPYTQAIAEEIIAFCARINPATPKPLQPLAICTCGGFVDKNSGAYVHAEACER